MVFLFLKLIDFSSYIQRQYNIPFSDTFAKRYLLKYMACAVYLTILSEIKNHYETRVKEYYLSLSKGNWK